MKKGILFGVLLISSIILSGCADVQFVEQCVTGHQYGFWGGFWHGFIITFSFIGSLFSDDIAIYAVNNNGGWYDFGFWFGVGCFGASPAITVKLK